MLFIKYSISNIILRMEMSMSIVKIIFGKSKSRHPNAQLKVEARDSFIREMAVFILETDCSCEMGYTFDNSHQIGNTCLI